MKKANIRFPFEKLVREHDNISLIRLNLEQASVPDKEKVMEDFKRLSDIVGES